MSDALSSLLGAGVPPSQAGINRLGKPGAPAGTWFREGKVYVNTDHYGDKRYYPANHFDSGVSLDFATREEAEKAAGMNAKEAAAMHTGGSGGAPDSALSQSNSMAPQAIPTTQTPSVGDQARTIDRLKPEWVKKQEQFMGIDWVYNEQTGKWEPSGTMPKTARG